MAILTEEECQKIWDSGKSINVDSPEGKQIMAYLARKQKKEGIKKVKGWVQGIQK